MSLQINNCLKLKQFLLPQDCDCCGISLNSSHDLSVCEQCLANFPWHHQSACPQCALPSFDGAVCGDCLQSPPDFDATTGFPKNTQAYRVSSNASSRVTTQGFALGLSHYIKNLILSGNYSWNVLNTKTDDPIIPAFNTPEHKFNLGVTGRDVKIGKIENLGFSLNYKWIKGFVFEGSPQFTGAIPTYDLVDGQINYTMPKINTTIKIGATNMLNKKQYQVYGGPRIGRMAYISLQYDWAKK